MKLEDIGFYTLSDYRASQCSQHSPLWRCELLLTHRCNFHCVYCRGLRSDCAGDIPLETARQTLDYWISDGLKNVRFSGGEPTLYPYLKELVKKCKDSGIDRIAISTNGSQTLDYYCDLIEAGVNDFSISLDSGCCAISEKLAGNIKGSFDKVSDNIGELSKLTYVSVGMVFTKENFGTCVDDVLFVDSLGVSDIRVIPSAQYNRALIQLSQIPIHVLDKYPILKYRINHINNGVHVRGISIKDTDKCYLCLDDMAIAGKWHFPCIIYLREGGNPIGKIGGNMRQERKEWFERHNTHKDIICSNNCLDVCRDYNNKAEGYMGGN
jgi:MoaA/NifB/PqqE/SkfB family radical SAM enzyme